VSLGHPCKFQRDSRLGSVTAQHSSSGRQPNFAALNRGRHLYSAGRPARWALAIVVIIQLTTYVISCSFKPFDAEQSRCKRRSVGVSVGL